MKVVFPSVEFFRALQTLMQSERERFKRLGYFDTRFGIRILDGSGAHQYVLGFEVFDCTEVRAVRDLNVESLDFVLEGDLGAWVEMLRNIQQHSAADVTHSINTLTHLGERMRVVYNDPDGHDKLYRFAESVQEFIDLAAKVEIDFAGGRDAAHTGA
jgi:ATP-dependent RNA circularization protein (DNA/RNA ligase family)